MCVCVGGENSWTDLTAVAAVSAQLFDHEGRAVQVTEPIHVSVPLPSDSRVRSPTSVPVWLYDTKTGTNSVMFHNTKTLHTALGFLYV